jgi:hypothetical protein
MAPPSEGYRQSCAGAAVNPFLPVQTHYGSRAVSIRGKLGWLTETLGFPPHHC